MCTWNETAEKRPRHMNCETLTSTASAQDAAIVIAAPGRQGMEVGGGWAVGQAGEVCRKFTAAEQLLLLLVLPCVQASKPALPAALPAKPLPKPPPRQAAHPG